MSKHPYPQWLSDEINEAIYLHYQSRDIFAPDSLDALDDTVGDVALRALWDASRVDTMQDVKQLPHDAYLLSATNEPYTPYNYIHAPLPDDYPAHVIYWGDHDG